MKKVLFFILCIAGLDSININSSEFSKSSKQESKITQTQNSTLLRKVKEKQKKFWNILKEHKKKTAVAAALLTLIAYAGWREAQKKLQEEKEEKEDLELEAGFLYEPLVD